jgi:protein O-mannosyl-transferase
MRLPIMLCLVLIAVTAGIYFQTGNHQFINFDDTVYVTDNPHVQGGITGGNIAWAFTAVTASNWHPLTWLSHMADVQLFGMDPRGHHLTSVFIHTASALLLFLLLAQITGFVWRSLFVAALFALHPLHVESVAWVAERKDVLSCFFWLLTLLLYARYVRKPSLNRYLLALFSFAAGLMAKPMLVTLPVVLLLLDYWPFNRFRKEPAADDATAGPSLANLFKEKLPFFLLSGLSSAITIYAQHHGGAMKNLDVVPLGLRIENSVVAYANYLGKTIWPHDLAILYPFPPSLPLWQAAGSFLLLALITVMTVWSRRRYPYLLVGWCWFLVTLVPVIGLVQVGGQSMADRYTYIPLIGLFIMAGWLIPELASGWRHRQEILVITAVVIISASAAATWRQLGYWKDSITLFRHTLEVTTGNYLILNNYGIALADRGDLDGAISAYREALRVWPNSSNAHINLGATLARQGKFDEAIGQYTEALRLQPDYALAYANLGKALAGLGRTGEAIGQYEHALKLDPSLADVDLNLAILLMKEGDRDSAIRHYETALRLDPYSPKVPINMGAALAKEGRLAEAADYFSQAIRIDPASVEAQFNLGVALAKQGKADEAARHFSEVLRLRPDAEAARHWLELLQRQK